MEDKLNKLLEMNEQILKKLDGIEQTKNIVVQQGFPFQVFLILFLCLIVGFIVFKYSEKLKNYFSNVSAEGKKLFCQTDSDVSTAFNVKLCENIVLLLTGRRPDADIDALVSALLNGEKPLPKIPGLAAIKYTVGKTDAEKATISLSVYLKKTDDENILTERTKSYACDLDDFPNELRREYLKNLGKCVTYNVYPETAS